MSASVLPTTHPINTSENQPSFVGSVARGSFKLAQAGVLAVGGVGLMMAGVGGAYVTSIKIKEFYFDKNYRPPSEQPTQPPTKENEGTESSYTGYREFPGFITGCEWICKTSTDNIGWPVANTTFCESMADKPFAKQETSFAAAALVSSLGLSATCYLGSLYCFLAGASMVNRSVEVFTSIL